MQSGKEIVVIDFGVRRERERFCDINFLATFEILLLFFFFKAKNVMPSLEMRENCSFLKTGLPSFQPANHPFMKLYQKDEVNHNKFMIQHGRQSHFHILQDWVWIATLPRPPNTSLCILHKYYEVLFTGMLYLLNAKNVLLSSNKLIRF